MPDLNVSIRKTIANQGYCLVEGTTETDMWAIASDLGVPRYETRDKQVVKLIRPHSKGLSEPNTLSSRYGTGTFPFHTDAAYWHTPPRFLLLRCLDPGEGNRCTLLSDPRAWLSKCSWETLVGAICTVAGNRSFLATIAAINSETSHSIRYDLACMKPTSRHSSEALALIETQAAKAPVTTVRWRHEALLIVDNHRLFHARGASSVADPNRLHQKLLVEEGWDGR